MPGMPGPFATLDRIRDGWLAAIELARDNHGMWASLLRASLVVLAVGAHGAAAAAERLPKGAWRPLRVPGASWRLPWNGTSAGCQFDHAVVTVAEVRTVARAEVVRLAIETTKAADDDCWDVDDLPTQFAFTRRGVYAFASDATDAVIAAGLKRRPAFTDPPRATLAYRRRDGYFAWAPREQPGAVCFGFGATDVNCGSAPCYAVLCLDRTGVIGIAGTVAGTSDGFGVDVYVHEVGGP